MTESIHPSPVYFGALYWRKSWFGPLCPPVILFYREGSLRLESEDHALFDVPVGQVKVQCTSLGTLKLTVDGCTYSLVGEAGTLARSLSDRQSRTLAAIAAIPGAWNLGSSTPSLFAVSKRTGDSRISFGADGSTVASAVSRGLGSMKLMPRWIQPLEQAGAQVRR